VWIPYYPKEQFKFYYLVIRRIPKSVFRSLQSSFCTTLGATVAKPSARLTTGLKVSFIQIPKKNNGTVTTNQAPNTARMDVNGKRRVETDPALKPVTAATPKIELEV
jgi:hypothetical protein